MFGFVNTEYTAYVIDGATAVHWVHASGQLFTYADRARTPTGLHAADRRQALRLAREIADGYLKELPIPDPITNPVTGRNGEPLVDEALAYAVLDHIAAHPARHAQNEWVSAVGDGTGCGTVACFAGWAVVLAGGTLLDGKRARLSIPGRTLLRYSDAHAVFDERHVASAAMTALGLDRRQADLLFDEENTVEDLRRLVEQFFGPRQTPPAAQPQTTSPPTPAEAIAGLWETVGDVADKLSILSALLADLIEDDVLYGRLSYGADPGEKHRLVVEVEEDLIAARTSVDNTAYYLKVGDGLAAKDRR